LDSISAEHLEGLIQGGQHFAGSSHARLGTALHESLEVVRGMIAGKINAPLGHSLVVPERGVLAHLIGAIASEQVRIASRIAERGQACVVLAHTRPHYVQLIEELLRVTGSDCRSAAGGVRPGWPVGRAFHPAGVIGQEAVASRFGAATLPGALEGEIGLNETVADPWPCATPIPITLVEL